MQDTFDDRYILTLGTKVSKKEIRLSAADSTTSVHVDLLVWDILSHRGFRELLNEAYFHGSRGILAVSDMTRRSTLEELDDWIRSVQSVAGPVPVAIIGANADQGERLEVTEEEVQRVASDYAAPCYFTAEGSEEGVEAALHYLASTVFRASAAVPPA